jgi:ATP-dependent Clp protease, protease subunit
VIDTKTSQALMRVLSDKINAGEKEIYILFSSMGGTVNDGVTLHNYIKSLPAKIIIYNIGIVDSIANVIFLAAEERYAVPNSSFLFHGVAQNILQPTLLDEKQLKERLTQIERDQQLISQIIAKNSSLTTEQVKAMFLQAKTLTPEEAKTVGIVHEIKEAKIPAGVQVLSLVFQ